MFCLPFIWIELSEPQSKDYFNCTNKKILQIICQADNELWDIKNCRKNKIYLFLFFRSSRQRCSVKSGVLRNFAKFTGEQLCQSLFLNKVAGLRPVTLLKKRFWQRCSLLNFAKFLRTPFLQNTSGGYFWF